MALESLCGLSRFVDIGIKDEDENINNFSEKYFGNFLHHTQLALPPFNDVRNFSFLSCL